MPEICIRFDRIRVRHKHFQNCIQIPREAELWQEAGGAQAVTIFSYLRRFSDAAAATPEESALAEFRR